MALTAIGHLDGHLETVRTRKWLRHKASKLLSKKTENEELRPDF